VRSEEFEGPEFTAEYFHHDAPPAPPFHAMLIALAGKGEALADGLLKAADGNPMTALYLLGEAAKHLVGTIYKPYGQVPASWPDEQRAQGEAFKAYADAHVDLPKTVLMLRCAMGLAGLAAGILGEMQAAQMVDGEEPPP
jgi:hypothetical protein